MLKNIYLLTLVLLLVACRNSGDEASVPGIADSSTADTVSAAANPADDRYFEDWPAGASPAEVGAKLATLFASQSSDGTKHYKEACAWYGAVAVAALLQDQVLVNTLARRYAPYIDSYDTLLAGDGHVDDNVFGIVPLEISRHDPDPAFRADGLALANHQLANLDAQIRFAIDDMFMITGLQMQAFRVTGDRVHLDAAASTMVLYLEKLQQADGTFNHRDTVAIKWGRGNGWVASGMTELMRELDPGHQHYAAIRAGYEAMMAGLLKYQIKSGEGAGLWKQILDHEGADNWPETSGSAMFTNAMLTGIRQGWLDAETYAPAARNAWLGLVGYLTPEGQLRGVSDWMYDGAVADYLARARVTGDNHGQAPMLWAAATLLR